MKFYGWRIKKNANLGVLGNYGISYIVINQKYWNSS